MNRISITTLLIVGCSSAGTVCGTGTALLDGTCVVDTTPPTDGSIVSGTDGSVDAGTAATLTCGTGTAESNNQCLPEWQTITNAGTASLQIASVLCGAVSTCCTAPILNPSTRDTAIELALYDRHLCEAAMVSLLSNQLGMLQVYASQSPPLLSVQADGLAALIAAYTPNGCNLMATDISALFTSMVTGLTPAGELCAFDGMCLAGTVCSSVGETGSDKRCRTPTGSGTPCSSSKDCSSGFYCNSTCTARLPQGTTCTNNSECGDGLSCFSATCETVGDTTATCDDTTDCGVGKYCETSQCVARKTVGVTCANGDECLEPTSCSSGTVKVCIDTASVCDIFQ